MNYLIKLQSFVLVIILFHSTTNYGQETIMKNQIKETIQLGRNVIIDSALTILENNNKVKDFNKTSVLTNGKEIIVSFTNPIKYLPIGTAYYCDVNVNLSTQTVYYLSTSNTSKRDSIHFYNITDKMQKEIDYVLTAIRNSKSVAPIDPKNFSEELIIREHDKYYDVTLLSDVEESSYKVNILTGRVYDIEHYQLSISPSEGQEDWVEIK